MKLYKIDVQENNNIRSGVYTRLNVHIHRCILDPNFRSNNVSDLYGTFIANIRLQSRIMLRRI